MPEVEDRPDVIAFGCETSGAAMPALEDVGNKARNLVHMANAGLPIPPGFVWSTRLCRAYYAAGGQLPDGFQEQLAQSMQRLESATKLTFGGERRPLLVSVRSGAAVSMPGMMDTLLNVGLCDRTQQALLRMTGNPRLVWDSYRRLVQTYGEIVHGLTATPFEQRLDEALQRHSVPAVRELDVAALRELTHDYLELFEALAREPFPQEPMTQLARSVEAVLKSWNSPRAVGFRRMNALDDLSGTAVTVQMMVFGNMGGTSGSGVAFSRDPMSGEDHLFLDFLWNAQGEDVVSGRCPVPDADGLQRLMPDLYGELCRVAKRLERTFQDVQDFEFTIQEGRLFILQARSAKRTSLAALRIACDLVKEGLIDTSEARRRLMALDLDSIQSVRLAAEADQPSLSAGTPASPGVAVGEIALDSGAARALAATGRTPVMVRADLSTDDIAGLEVSAGIVSARGGRTSHAAVVARHLNKVCIVGCRGLVIQESLRRCRIGDHELAEGDCVSLDGHSGRVFRGRLEVLVEKPQQYLQEIAHWQV
jgi:pyruvate,orthophosphate dikinase